MRLPGFNAERALGASGRSYRSRGGAAGAGLARPAIIGRNPRIQPQERDVTRCTDCHGQSYNCALNERCAKLCTTDGQGYAWCEPL